MAFGEIGGRNQPQCWPSTSGRTRCDATTHAQSITCRMASELPFRSWEILHETAIRNNHNRRARMLEVGGKLSSGLSGRLFKLQRGKCACCKLPLGDDYHLDHIIPIDLGGANEDWNIQLLRAKCNCQKHNTHPIDFMQSKGFLL